MGPNLSVVRKNCSPAFRSGIHSVFMNICCNKKFVGFSTSQQRRTSEVFGNGV